MSRSWRDCGDGRRDDGRCDRGRDDHDRPARAPPPPHVLRHFCLDDALPTLPARLSMAELSLGDLEQRPEQLGRGATCSVRLCVGPERKLYALKIVEKAKIRGENALARLFREKEILSAVDHPGVVGLHGALKDEANLYFVLELLAGGELLWHMRRAQRRRLPPSQVSHCLRRAPPSLGEAPSGDGGHFSAGDHLSWRAAAAAAPPAGAGRDLP